MRIKKIDSNANVSQKDKIVREKTAVLLDKHIHRPNPRRLKKSPSTVSSEFRRYTKASLDFLGERIVEIRKIRKVKQRELAKRLKITEAHLRNMEKGKIFPRLPVLIKIINEFDINPNYLFLEFEAKKTRYLIND